MCNVDNFIADCGTDMKFGLQRQADTLKGLDVGINCKIPLCYFSTGLLGSRTLKELFESYKEL